jgi:hypothetical protein
MILWTIQSVEVYKEILNKGYYTCKKNNPNIDKDYIRAYEYISKYMKNKIYSKSTENLYPIWAWYKCNGKNKKPDLKELGYKGRKKEYVCLEIEKNDADVVLSDFDLWHFVLWNEYYPNEIDEKLWNQEIAQYEKLSAKEKEIEKINSWNNIFDTEYFENDLISKGKYIQATFWKLYAKEIKEVKYFKAD